MIFFGTQRLLEESQRRHPRLVDLMAALDASAQAHGWDKVVVTSMLRTAAENKAAKAKTRIHCEDPIRAADSRTRDVDDEIVATVGHELNTTWLFDPFQPGKPVAYWEPHGTGPHLHLQITPRTRRVP